jgi:hypothetical protein
MMADALRTAALRAVAAIAALEAEAEAQGKLWPSDQAALASARGVAQRLT